jgi:hypothetical protein
VKYKDRVVEIIKEVIKEVFVDRIVEVVKEPELSELEISPAIAEFT